jgi:predicted DNA-binding antitoxin AbrB/MazE fold protein
MTIDVEAIYEDGVLKLKGPVNLPERAEVHVTIEAPDLARTPLGRKLLELRSRITKSGARAVSISVRQPSSAFSERAPRC